MNDCNTQIARAQLGEMANGCGEQKSCALLETCDSVDNCTVGATFAISGEGLIIEIAGVFLRVVIEVLLPCLQVSCRRLIKANG